ncbi:MAG: DUF2769 domain-containing protein [Patescibacteria group bacterium]
MPVEDTSENRNQCVCPDCPSMPADCPEETIYCAVAKSQCRIEQKGCICGTCPVQIANNLQTGYYCDKGKAD